MSARTGPGLVRLTLIRTPYHFPANAIVGFLNLMILCVVLGVWALQLVLFAIASLIRLCITAGGELAPEPAPEPARLDAAPTRYSAARDAGYQAARFFWYGPEGKRAPR